jgi:aminoglycoside phosphotransferase (APT) family kinase protein
MAELDGVAVTAAVAQLLSAPVEDQPIRLALGYGNENWRVVVAGRPLLLKIAPRQADLGKAEAASRAQRIAASTGAPVAREILFDPSCQYLDGRIARIFEFLPGLHPASTLISPAANHRFFTSLGRAVATLHSHPCDGFSSRIGAAPTFTNWAAYVAYRIPQIVERGRTAALLAEDELDAMFGHALALAETVSAVVEPAVTHRDLYLDNLLTDEGALLTGILDFDNAEAWDPAADLVKLRWQVFPHYAGAEHAFHAGYHSTADPLPRIEKRVRIAEILELSNHAIGARLQGREAFAQASCRRLRAVLNPP